MTTKMMMRMLRKTRLPRYVVQTDVLSINALNNLHDDQRQSSLWKKARNQLPRRMPINLRIPNFKSLLP